MTQTGTSRGVMRPAELEGLDGSYEQRLIDGVRPIAEHFLAACLHHLFRTGLYDRLGAVGEAAAIEDVAKDLDMDPWRLRGFLLYLANEDIVTVDGDAVALTRRAESYAEFRTWYTFLIGGYSGTVAQIGAGLRTGAPPCGRNGADVGVASCELARFDGMPMTDSLLRGAGIHPRTVLDLGCGSGLYLIEMCRQMPGITAWGAEPDASAYAEAQALVASSGLQDRVRLVNTSAGDFLRNPPEGCLPDLLVFGYVLQEILGQQDRDAVIELLRSIVSAFPRIDIVVIEVANEIANPGIMRHQLARNYWNLYYLMHYFTNQRLETQEFWDELFTDAGLRIRDVVTAPLAFDSTGLELGYLLGGPERSA